MAPSQTAPSAVQNIPRVRMRTRQACQACRKRRRKCDGRFPCGQCSFYQYDCVFTKQDSETLTRRNTESDRQSHTRTGQQPTQEVTKLIEHQGPIHLEESNDDAVARPVEAQSSDRDHAVRERVLHDPVPGFLDERKGRYCGLHSAVVFPHLVQTLVKSSAYLRLHSYGWNVNSRQEPQPPSWNSIRRVITYQEILKFSEAFFETVGPVYELFDPTSYHERSRIYWASHADPSPDFEALVAGIVALGSLFSREGSMAELQLVEHAKTILDIGCCYAPGRLSTDQAAAWVLRTIYLRCTTRPHIAWLASCTSMHVVEALGLHLGQAISTNVADNGRLRIFHCALLINGIISAEYGRSRVRIDMPYGIIPDTVPSSRQLALARALFALEEPLAGVDRLESLERISQLHIEHSVSQLQKVDVAMHWYRRHVHGEGHASLTHAEQKIFVDLIGEGLSHVPGLLASAYPWSHVISTPFQSLLVLLSIDSDASLALIPEALKCLKSVSDTFCVSLATEAVEAAQHLVKALKQKKMAHAHLLLDGDNLGSSPGAGDMDITIPASGDILSGGEMDDWLEMFDFNADLAWVTSAGLS